jgi:ribosomal protein L19E
MISETNERNQERRTHRHGKHVQKRHSAAQAKPRQTEADHELRERHKLHPAPGRKRHPGKESGGNGARPAQLFR